LRLSVSTSPVARRTQVSPLHSIPPRFRDEESASSSDDDNDAVDTNLEEDLLVEIRTLVKKEKYLEQLENELREYGEGSESEIYSLREALDQDEDEMPLRRATPESRHGDSSTTTERRSLPTRACVNNAIIAKEHFRACFVEVNPVQLRGIRTLILSSQDLQIHHLRALSKNLFLFSSLKSVDLSDNQLDDSGSKEIRTRHLAEQLQQGGKHSSLLSLGLCYAEVSRRVVLNTVKMANRLTALDLSFAFIGIPGAQVVAAALRIESFATLTQLNMRCNRTKSMGAQAILAALHKNERLTFLDLSHNEIRSEAVDVLVELLEHNNVLSRLDLSENDLIGEQRDGELHSLCDAIVGHGALLSLGQLNSLGANEDQQRVLQDGLDRNRIADDHKVLESINAVTASRPTDESAPPRKRHVLSTMVELNEAETLTTVWQRKITRSGRVSLKWRMAVRRKLRTLSSPPLEWKLVVDRKCEARGSVEDEAATAQFFHDEEVAYCDRDDTISLKLGVEDEASECAAKQQYKVFIKDIAFIPHHRVYIHTSGVFRLLCRVQYPASFTRSNQDTLKSRYWWQLQRSSCWDPHTNHIVLEGTYFDLYGALRDNREVVFYLPPMEWMAGEYLQLSVTTPSDDVVLRLVQFQLFHEVTS
ncbi:hypothetical protein PHYSODRAFT_386046, partial [Phytophthora sojae]